MEEEIEMVQERSGIEMVQGWRMQEKRHS